VRSKICGPGRLEYHLPGPLLQEEKGVSRHKFKNQTAKCKIKEALAAERQFHNFDF
jgi:hypothetical protein